MKSYLFYEDYPEINANIPIQVFNGAVGVLPFDSSKFVKDKTPEILPDENNHIVPTSINKNNIYEIDGDMLIPKSLLGEKKKHLPDTLIFHIHKFMEISLVTNDEFIFIVNRKLVKVSKGDIVIFNKMVPHAWLMEKNGEPSTKTFSFSSDNLLFNSHHHDRTDFVYDFLNNDFIHLLISKDSDEIELFYELLDCIEKENDEKQAAHHTIIKLKLMEFFAYLARFSVRNQNSNFKKIPEGLTFALEYINQNYNQQLTLNYIANICYMSPQYFSTLFKKHMGVTFNYYLTQIRLEHAIRLLQNSEMNIITIAFQSGFSSTSNFYRAFHAVYKVSPTDVRKAFFDNESQK